MQPTLNTLLLAGFWTLLGFSASLLPQWQIYWFWGGLGALILVVLDFIAGLMVRTPGVDRKLPGRFAIGVERLVPVTLRNHSTLAVRLVYYDGITDDAESEELPWRGRIKAGGYAAIEYPVTISERGMKEFDRGYLRLFSPLGFWTRSCRVGAAEITRVYPNYEPVLRYALLAMDNRADQMGIVKKNRVGISKEFHQLRDYQIGDMLSQVDWKATSKRVSLVSREYQEQRDQTVILAVDCGRRMRALDGGVPQFDHCLNAMLLLAYTALRQGDHVGVIGVSGSERWLAPVKGVQSMTTILNHLYDYSTTASPSDFTEAAERLLTRQQRRALVVMLSNVRGEDGHQLVDPLRMVRRRHVTILANLREESVMKRMTRPSRSLGDALEVGASSIYLEEREQVLGELRAHGIYTVDSTATELPVALANAYLGAREMV